MTESIYLSDEYVLVRCGADGCDQFFGMPRHFYDETRRTSCGWHCPRGHSRVWKGETTEQKLVAAHARQQHLEDQLRAAEADAEATRVRMMRDRQRFANGVCPCCNRSFENVRRHMATKHPDYDPGGLTAPRYECSCGRSFATFHGLRIHQSKQRSGDWLDPKQGRYWRHLTVASR